MGGREDKLGLYADDLILFMDSVDLSLPRAIDLINRFGDFSGLRINWSKSALMPLWSPGWPPVYHNLGLLSH